jgi:hypothetical protein
MLDVNLNEKILRLAPKFEAKEFAPDSFAKLRANITSGLVVWSGASENTIYGDPIVNHAFRAWHDSTHIRLNADFSPEGEKRVALEQARLIGSDMWAKILIGEVVGQAEYFAKYGKFPANQVEFMVNYLKGVL